MLGLSAMASVFQQKWLITGLSLGISLSTKNKLGAMQPIMTSPKHCKSGSFMHWVRLFFANLVSPLQSLLNIKSYAQIHKYVELIVYFFKQNKPPIF